MEIVSVIGTENMAKQMKINMFSQVFNSFIQITGFSILPLWSSNIPATLLVINTRDTYIYISNNTKLSTVQILKIGILVWFH